MEEARGSIPLSSTRLARWRSLRSSGASSPYLLPPAAVQTPRRLASPGCASRASTGFRYHPGRGVRPPAGDDRLDVERHLGRRRAVDGPRVDLADANVDRVDLGADGGLRGGRGDARRAASTSLRRASVGGRYESCSSFSFRLIHQSSSRVPSSPGSGFPLPGRLSKSPRAMPSRICFSTKLSHCAAECGGRSIAQFCLPFRLSNDAPG